MMIVRDARLNELRDKNIQIRVNAAEVELFNKAAKRQKLTVAELVRELVLDYCEKNGIKLEDPK